MEQSVSASIYNQVASLLWFAASRSQRKRLDGERETISFWSVITRDALKVPLGGNMALSWENGSGSSSLHLQKPSKRVVVEKSPWTGKYLPYFLTFIKAPLDVEVPPAWLGARERDIATSAARLVPFETRIAKWLSNPFIWGAPAGNRPLAKILGIATISSGSSSAFEVYLTASRSRSGMRPWIRIVFRTTIYS